MLTYSDKQQNQYPSPLNTTDSSFDLPHLSFPIVISGCTINGSFGSSGIIGALVIDVDDNFLLVFGANRSLLVGGINGSFFIDGINGSLLIGGGVDGMKMSRLGIAIAVYAQRSP
eukprot:TRINITY_DN600_c0_g1_i11.p7 TRINITY_DN600_c0_g1~~TRINITY_DN600_c0_g1_i11.p7  ORF type:complete len:115 (+),score=3.92 TRINITY_DN600_c0_g1_i11:111-455(+)